MTYFWGNFPFLDFRFHNGVEKLFHFEKPNPRSGEGKLLFRYSNVAKTIWKKKKDKCITETIHVDIYEAHEAFLK